jgi:hypothetical protein
LRDLSQELVAEESRVVDRVEEETWCKHISKNKYVPRRPM